MEKQSYIDSLRKKYPYHIIADGYHAYLHSIQPLIGGEEAPIYRFPGGTKVVFSDDINSDRITIVER